jgi:hypothetical protein
VVGEKCPGRPQMRQPLTAGRARRLKRTGLVGMGNAPVGFISGMVAVGAVRN